MTTARLGWLLAAMLVASCDRPAALPASPAGTAGEPPSDASTPGALAAGEPRGDARPEATGSPAEPALAAAAAPAAAGSAPAPAAPGSAPAPAPAAPGSASAILREAAALEPGGAVLALGGEEETVVDPKTTFRVTLGATAADARLTILDGRDALVPSRGTREVGVSSTVLTIEPSDPLVPAARYTLRLDGAITRELHDSDGRAHAPLAFRLLAAGEPPPPEPKPAPKKARRR